jgi:hypothetical protein
MVRSIRHVVRSFIKFAHGIEHQVGRGAQHGTLQRSCTVHKFVHAVAAMHALKNVNYRFVAKIVAAFRVSYFSRIKKHQGVNLSGIDVQGAGLAGLAEHLHHTGKIMMSQASAEAGVGLIQHLRGLKAFGLADDDLFYMRGDSGLRAVPVDIVVAAGLKRFKQGALAAISIAMIGRAAFLGSGVNSA